MSTNDDDIHAALALASEQSSRREAADTIRSLTGYSLRVALDLVYYAAEVHPRSALALAISGASATPTDPRGEG